MEYDLNAYVYLSVIYLKIMNQEPLEFIVYELLKNEGKLMTIEQIIDKLFFIKEIDRKKLWLILNCYNNIYCNDNKYYYCEKEKSTKDNIESSLYKIKYINELDLCSLVYNLLSKKGKPLHISKIKTFLDTIIHVNEKELEEKLSKKDEFKLIGHKTYVLSSWEKYKNFYYDIDKDISIFRDLSKTSDRNWDIFRRYKILNKETTLQKIGDIYGLSKEAVRQIIKKVHKKIKHNKYESLFKKYFIFIEELIDDYGVIYLTYEDDVKKIKKIFNDWDVIEVMNLLNVIGNKFVIIDNKYIYKRDKYEYVINYLNYIIRKMGKTFVGSKHLDAIYNKLKMKKLREEEFLIMLINKDNRFYINKDKNLCCFSKGFFTKYNLIYKIIEKIGKPIHYSIVMKEYTKITGEEMNSKNIILYLDRKKDLFVRVFIGTYALKEWGYNEHVSVMDLVIELLEKKQCAMHYRDIYEFIKDRTLAKERTMYCLMQSDERIASLGYGFYGLASQIKDGNADIKYYSNIVEKNNNRRLGYLLAKCTNKYGNVCIVYRFVNTIMSSYTIKIPEVFNIKLDSNVYIFDKDYNKYDCFFNINSSNLYGIIKFIRAKKLKQGDIIVLEFVSSNIIRMFTKYEYDNEYEVFELLWT